MNADAKGNPSTGASPAEAAVEGRGRAWGWPAILALAGASAFLPVLRHGFVFWDDELNFTSNPDFGALSWGGVRWAWTAFLAGVYQPLAWMFLEAQASFCGLDARGYHAVSVLLHSANSVVLYRLVLALLDRASEGEVRRDRRAARDAAALATLLYAVHPMRVEVVAWASCQPYLPSILCAMLATLAYLRAHPAAGPTSGRWVALAWLGYSLAVLFKVESVTLPAALVILDVYPLGRLGPGRWIVGRVWWEKVPFAIPALVVMALAVRARSAGQPTATGVPYDLPTRLAGACYAAWFYPVKTVWPTRLSIYYEMPERVGLTAWPFWPAELAMVLVGLVALLVRRRRPGVGAAWATYLVLLSPHLGFINSGPVIAADRYSYLAAIPWVVLLAGGLERLIARGGAARVLTRSGGMCLAAWLAVMSWEQCQTWTSSEVLLRSDLARGGRKPEVRSSLGAVLFRAGRTDEAAAFCEEALGIVPDLGQAHLYLGLIRARQGRFAEAERHFAATVRLFPDERDAHYNLAVALARLGRPLAAIEHYRRALELRPMAETAVSLALLLKEQGRLAEAVSCYELALRLEPDARTHNNLGAVLALQGRFSEAEAQFQQAIRLRPDYPAAYAGLEMVRQRLNRGP